MKPVSLLQPFGRTSVIGIDQTNKAGKLRTRGFTVPNRTGTKPTRYVPRGTKRKGNEDREVKTLDLQVVVERRRACHGLGVSLESRTEQSKSHILVCLTAISLFVRGAQGGCS